MNIDIRKAVLHNIDKNNQQQIKDTITDAVARNEEVVLPGLGVLMEVLWKESTPDQQQQILSTLEKGVQ